MRSRSAECASGLPHGAALKRHDKTHGILGRICGDCCICAHVTDDCALCSRRAHADGSVGVGLLLPNCRKSIGGKHSVRSAGAARPDFAARQAGPHEHRLALRSPGASRRPRRVWQAQRLRQRALQLPPPHGDRLARLLQPLQPLQLLPLRRGVLRGARTPASVARQRVETVSAEASSSAWLATSSSLAPGAAAWMRLAQPASRACSSRSAAASPRPRPPATAAGLHTSTYNVSGVRKVRCISWYSSWPPAS